MKHWTLVFCKVLSGLYQQEAIASKRKDLLLNAWQEAVKTNDKKKLKTLVSELTCINTNRVWQAELNKLLEEL